VSLFDVKFVCWPVVVLQVMLKFMVSKLLTL